MTLRLAAKAWHLLVCCALLAVGMARAEPQATVAVLLSETGRPHLEVLEALRTELGRAPGANIVLVNGQEPVPKGTALIVTVGVSATETVARMGAPAPVLAILIPKASFENLSAQVYGREHQKLSAVFLDLPPRRQLALLHQAFPERKRVALLVGSASEPQAAAFSAAAQELGMSLLSAPVHAESEIYPALQRLLPEADLLLALPDPSVYNSRTIQDILLTSYRFRVPLVGFSPAYVKAGALLALYSTPTRIGSQAADMARSFLAGRPLPLPQYARDFDVGTNPHVARSLGIGVEPENTLRDRLRQSEHLP
ncbi:MAG: ABC transporter substrate binding protein [Rhodocyclaceae bacterium]|nr:ABC transporter substrate binding protein [Rhodocyclaceae bacterium]